jgi:Translation initiation factor 2 (IF-2; GTPase)
LASASNAVVVGFNVKVEGMAVPVAKREGVQVKLYSIIYELLDQIKKRCGSARSRTSRNGDRTCRS